MVIKSKIVVVVVYDFFDDYVSYDKSFPTLNADKSWLYNWSQKSNGK